MPNHRQIAEAERRRALVMGYWKKGQRNQTRIRALLETDHGIKIDRSTVAKMIAKQRKLWRESAETDFTEEQTQVLEEIELVKFTYWQEWERSQKDIEETSQMAEESGEQIKEVDGQPIPVLVKDIKKRATNKTRERLGDPRFLQGVERMIEQRRQVLGIDKPVADPSKTAEEIRQFLHEIDGSIEGPPDDDGKKPDLKVG